MSGLPSYLVTAVPGEAWTTLQEGSANMEKTLINITAAGSTQLPGSATTFTDVYVNAPGAVSITMPILANLVAGQEWTFKDISGAAGTNPITILPSTGYLFDASSSFQINFNYGAITLVWDGTNMAVKT